MLAATAPFAGPPAEDAVQARFYHPFRAEALGQPLIGPPPGVAVLPPRGTRWPPALLAELEARVATEWPVDTAYGMLRNGIPLFLRYPLVIARSDARAVAAGGEEVRILVPVLGDSALPIAGRLMPSPLPRARRVVVLLDTSSSANTSIHFRDARGRAERIRILDAERRVLEHLVERADREHVELGVIAFGETTTPINPPGPASQALRERLAAHARAHPTGAGRTDMICALWLAREWLQAAPAGASREVVLLTDGDLPHSGRFIDCGHLEGDRAVRACEARRNTTTCPAAHRFRAADGRSDPIQLAAFARRTRRELAVHPLVFEPDRAARAYRELASRTGGSLGRIGAVADVEATLPGLVAHQVRSVVAENRTTGARTGDLYDPSSGRFEGQLPLVPGGNDVELRVDGEGGPISLARFRIHVGAESLARHLATLRQRTLELEARVRSLVADPEAAGVAPSGVEREPRRTLDVAPEPLPALPR